MFEPPKSPRTPTPAPHLTVEYIRHFNLLVRALATPRSLTTDPGTYKDLKRALKSITYGFEREGGEAETIKQIEEMLDRVFDPLSPPHAEQQAHDDFIRLLLTIYKKMPRGEPTEAAEFEKHILSSNDAPL